MHFTCAAVHLAFYASDVRIPDAVGFSIGMANVVSKMSALTTNIAFCHDCTSSTYISRSADNICMIAEFVAFGK